MGMLTDAMIRAAEKGKGAGSKATQQSRKFNLRDVARFLQKTNIQVRKPEQITPKHIANYLESCDISKGTAQNRMASIRAMWRGTGSEKCAKWADKNNAAFGIDGRSRVGTKRALSEDFYNHVHSALIEKGCEREAAALSLQRVLGLRRREAVMSQSSLKTWKMSLETGEVIRVIRGTKGGRQRDTRISDRSAALEAIENAIKLAGRGYIVRGKSGTLKSALDRLDNTYRAVGLAGDQTSHSARYAFAQQNFEWYQDQGFSRKESLAMVSMDLGHGDGRGRYISSVYSLR